LKIFNEQYIKFIPLFPLTQIIKKIFQNQTSIKFYFFERRHSWTSRTLLGYNIFCYIKYSK